MKKQIIGLILAMNAILSADQLSLDTNITEVNTSNNSIQQDQRTEKTQRKSKCHMQYKRGNPLNRKCIKQVDSNLTLINIYSYTRSL
jgi:hypothetical protein